MNRFKAIGSALLLVPALALLSTPARAEFKCNSPTVTFDRVACEKAKEGPDALRQYIQRIQGITNLQFSDYVNEARAAAWAETMRAGLHQKSAPFNRPGSSKKIRVRNGGRASARQLDAAHFMRETLRTRSELRVFTLEKMGAADRRKRRAAATRA